MTKLRTTLVALGATTMLALAPLTPSATAEAPAAEAKAKTTVTIGSLNTQAVGGRVASPRAACKKQRVVRMTRQFAGPSRGKTNARGFYKFSGFILLPGERVTITAPATPKCKADSASRS